MVLQIAFGIVFAWFVIVYLIPLAGVVIQVSWVMLTEFWKSSYKGATVPRAMPARAPFPGWKPIFRQLFTGEKNKKDLKKLGYIVAGVAVYMGVILVAGLIASKK